jgi:hypothetical protein
VQRAKKKQRIEQTLTFDERLAPILLRFERWKQRLSGCDEQQQEELDDAVLTCSLFASCRCWTDHRCEFVFHTVTIDITLINTDIDLPCWIDRKITVDGETRCL